MVESWTILDSKPIIETPFFHIRQEHCLLPNGLEIPDYYIIHQRDVVEIFALTPLQELILVEQYKHGIGEVTLELPAGVCDSEDPAHDAMRELREETGYSAEEFIHIGSFIQNPTRGDSRLHVYLAINARPAGTQELDPTEDIRVQFMALTEVLDAMRQGRIASTNSIASIWQSLDYLRGVGWLNA